MLAKKIALSIGLAIIFPVMIHYGVSTFFPAPNWNDYNVQINQNGTPEYINQQIAEHNRKQELGIAAQNRYEKHLFVIAVPLGLAAIFFGAFARVQAIGTGMMLGGIFSICDGYYNFWYELADWKRFLSFLAAFIVLLFVGYKKIEKKEI
jgi:hypothetical protein